MVFCRLWVSKLWPFFEYKSTKSPRNKKQEIYLKKW